MTSGGNNFNDFPENQLANFRVSSTFFIHCVQKKTPTQFLSYLDE